MARGYWRNWEEIECATPLCDNIVYKKDAVEENGKFYCQICKNRGNRTKRPHDGHGGKDE